MIYMPFYTKWKRRRELRQQFHAWKAQNHPELTDAEAAKIFFAPIIECWQNINSIFDSGASGEVKE